MTITIAVAGRIATATATTQVVAGNTYPVALSLDSEWTGSLFMRVRFGSLFYDIPFASSDATVDVQFPVGYPEVGIGIFSEALQVCTSEARVRLLRSILEAGEEVVEFDGDLYDQWAGEVTTLLTDDAFNATSDRPVQNAVITAWKDTVALDASVVHNTGNETVAGIKTFTSLLTASNVQVKDASTPTVTMLKGSTEVANLASDGTQAGLTASSQFFGLRGLDATPFGQAPSYTADNSADAKIVTRAMLASTPTVVHTTGNETIAGTKTFTNPIIAKSANTYNSFTIGSRGLSQTLVSRRYASDGETNDQSFVVGTTYSNATTNYLRLGVWSPRATIGDTSEAQAVANLTLKVGNDDKMELYLTADLRDGTHKNFSLATFDGAAWHPAWESSR